MLRCTAFLRVVVAVFASAGWSIASAQAPITILVGFAAGGATDLNARIIAEPLRKAFNRPVIVENRPGAGGIIAAEQLKRSPADGSVILVTPLFVPVLAPLTYRKLAFDPVRDFAPIAQVVKFQQAFAVPASHPARTMAEFLEWTRSNPKDASYGIAAAGSAPHFLGVWVSQAAGVAMVAVPYKGAAPMLNDLMAARIAAGVDILPDMSALHRAGRIRILAVSGSTRSALCPDVPTFAEQGLTSIDATSWLGVYAPAGTPKALREEMARAIATAMQSPEVRERLSAMGYEPTGTTPDEFAAISAADSAHWAPIIKASGFRAD
jgi:tripartite-type tricarboxylate transporter receptor subunit TctC